MKKYVAIIAVLVVAAVAALFLIQDDASQPTTLGNSPTGTKFGVQKVASVAWSLASGSATSTSLYNNDVNDRVVQDSFFTCDSVGTSRTAYTGAGLAALSVQAATTSTAAPAIVTNTNFVVNLNPVATTSPWFYTASSTEPVLSNAGRFWASGSYLTFFANATNTAQCIAGVRYIEK